jgi:hypothetical protein
MLLGDYTERIKKGCKVRLKAALKVNFEIVNIKADEVFSILQ